MCQSQPRLETCWACWKMVVRATIKTWNCENAATKTETKMSSPKHGTELNMHCCQRGSNQVIVTMILMTMDMIMITHDDHPSSFRSPPAVPFPPCCDNDLTRGPAKSQAHQKKHWY
jgi:hypothetical protein